MCCLLQLHLLVSAAGAAGTPIPAAPGPAKCCLWCRLPSGAAACGCHRWSTRRCLRTFSSSSSNSGFVRVSCNQSARACKLPTAAAAAACTPEAAAAGPPRFVACALARPAAVLPSTPAAVSMLQHRWRCTQRQRPLLRAAWQQQQHTSRRQSRNAPASLQAPAPRRLQLSALATTCCPPLPTCLARPCALSYRHARAKGQSRAVLRPSCSCVLA